MSITVKTTSGEFVLDEWLGALPTAREVLERTRENFPGSNFVHLIDQRTFETVPEGERVEDGTTLYAMTPQPVDA